MKRFSQAILSALGVRRYLIIGTSFAAATAYEVIRAALSAKGLVQLPDLPSWQLATLAALLIVVWAVAQRTITLEDSLKPRIRISMAHVDPALERIKSDTGAGVVEHRANYVHVVVENASELEVDDCRGYLISAWRIPAIGDSIKAPFKNPIHLVTASRHEKSVTLSPKIPVHFDLVYATSRTNQVDTSPALLKPNLLGPFFNTPGTYRLRVAVSAKGAPTAEADLEITWSKWDDIAARIGESG